MSSLIDHFLFFSTEIAGEILALDTKESHHAHSVLRVAAGDTIFVTDGNGHIYACRVEKIDKRSVLAKILQKKVQAPPSPAMQFFVGLPEKDAFEKVLSGLVPLGVMHITPVICQFCQKRWWEKNWEKQVVRFRKKMITAAKQSWNAWLPVLNKPVRFKEAVSNVQGLLFVADQQGETLDIFTNKIPGDVSNIACFVGPSGGFSPEELTALKDAGAHGIKLSENRLRTELAAAVLAGNVVQKFT